MDDERILDLFFARSERAIAALAEKYGPALLRQASNVLGDPRDAEECVNDAYLAVWNTVPPQRPAVLPGYVSRIVRNLALKKYRANTALKRNSVYDVALEELEGCLPAPDDVEAEADARETARRINAFLETLDKESRILFVRRYWHADSVETLAELFSTSRHNVSVRLSRIRKRLTQYLKEEGKNR